MNIDQSILDIIEGGKTEGNLFYLPTGQLDRKTYVKVNKVLECLGGKWNRKAKAHVFESSISDAIDNVLLTGEVVDMKKEFQFFETPPDVVKKLIEMADVKPRHMCLEPSAGRGAIATALDDIVKRENLICVELEPRNATVLAEYGFEVYCRDFIGIEFPSPFMFDRVVMNPPFTRQQDIDHVLCALEFVKPGGTLVSIMSAGVMFRQNKKTLSFWEEVHSHVWEVVELPADSFKVSGTGVNTIILKVTK